MKTPLSPSTLYLPASLIVVTLRFPSVDQRVPVPVPRERHGFSDAKGPAGDRVGGLADDEHPELLHRLGHGRRLSCPAVAMRAVRTAGWVCMRVSVRMHVAGRIR